MSLGGAGGRRGSRGWGDAGLIVQRFDRVEDAYWLSRQKMGSGSFGSVALAECRSTGVVRAAKTIPQSESAAAARQWKMIGGPMNEAEIMTRVDHPHIVKLFEIFHGEEELHLLMERCAGGDLAQVLRRGGRFSVPSLLIVMRQVLCAVSYMHAQDIVHRDMKLENLLLVRAGMLEANSVKVADFGLSCSAPAATVLTLRVGTIRFWAPEVAEGRYGRGCDVWSCGVCAYTMLSGQVPFDGKSDEEVLSRIRRGNFSLSGRVWDIAQEVKDIVRGLLKYRAEDRISAQSCAMTLRPWTPCRVAMPTGPGLARCLESLLALPRVRRATLQSLAWQVEGLEDLAALFSELDTDCDGVLSARDLHAALMDAGADEASDLAERAAPLSFTDFVVTMRGEALCLRRHAYRAAFQALDRDGDGVVSGEDLRRSRAKCAGELQMRSGGLDCLDYAAFVENVRVISL